MLPPITCRRWLLLNLASFAVMLPWPALGILLLRSSFEQPLDASLFVGGVTLFPLLIVALCGIDSEEATPWITGAVWLLAAFLPNLLLRKHLNARAAVIGVLVAQSVFSFAQALMGALLLVGRSV